jgi:hypothetical protein
MMRPLHVLAWATLAGLVAWAALAVLAWGLASGWPGPHLPAIEINGWPWAAPWADPDTAHRPVAAIVLGVLAAVVILPVAALLPLLVVAAVLLLVLAVVALVTLAACSPLLLLGALAWLVWRGRRRGAEAGRNADTGAVR